MKIEYQVTPELSLLVSEDGMVEYSLHNRIYPQAHISSIITEKEFLKSIEKQIKVLRLITSDKFYSKNTLKTFIDREFNGLNIKLRGVECD